MSPQDKLLLALSDQVTKLGDFFEKAVGALQGQIANAQIEIGRLQWKLEDAGVVKSDPEPTPKGLYIDGDTIAFDSEHNFHCKKILVYTGDDDGPRAPTLIITPSIEGQLITTTSNEPPAMPTRIRQEIGVDLHLDVECGSKTLVVSFAHHKGQIRVGSKMINQEINV